ncbi:glutathione S-transferase [Auricularia subglabra TFB-10046 SS5]|nr:glutathione S-transferase [Auricularia subglabra TFB-10046 SS5]
MSRDVSSQVDISKGKFHGADGSFQRAPSSFRNTLTPEQAQSGRYHLYVSYACPWATRALIVRKLKGLDAHIGVTVVSPRMGEHGWPLGDADPFPGADRDPHEGAQHIKDLYLKAAPDYSGRFTVPVLWDTQHRTIVNNESSEIIRILNTAFNALLPPAHAALDLYPEHLRAEIDALNEWVYSDVNNGVYRSGFAATQDAYEAAVTKLFAALDRLEGILAGGKKYLVGDLLTEADVRLFVTLIRFDPVYVGHFKCNLRTIRDGYPELNRWMKTLYWTEDAFKSTANFAHIKTHYYWSHPHINPTRVVPVGPVPDIQPL